MKKLVLGSGRRDHGPSAVCLDRSPDVGADIVWDLDRYPYPLETQSFDVIECKDVIEHLHDIPATLAECHRILKPGGLLILTTPHFSSSNSYTDPTHRKHLSYFSFDYFTPTHGLNYYSAARFEILRRSLFFEGSWFRKKLLGHLANRFPKSYESRWAWLCPAWFLYFELRSLPASQN